MVEMMKFREKQPKYERCVLCNQQTDVLVGMPVKDREHYIAAAGQICQKCYLETYIKQEK